MANVMHRNSLFDLAGRTALVTGASSGLGAHFAQVLAANGANVVLAARRLDMLSAVRDHIVAAGGKAIAVAMDVTDETSTAQAFDQAEAAFGVVDTVVANAGTAQSRSSLKLTAEEVDTILGINVKGVFLTAREAMRRMSPPAEGAHARGRVILNASITGSAVVSGLAMYGASKAAVIHLGRTLAREWINRGVNVNVISPGYIPTDITGGLFESERGAAMKASWPRKRLMDLDALDGALLFLASDASRFTTGAVIDIDDGQML